jgi:hypothetical protein
MFIVIPAGAALWVLVSGIGDLPANEPFFSSVGKFLLHEFPGLTARLTGFLALVWFGTYGLYLVLHGLEILFPILAAHHPL